LIRNWPENSPPLSSPDYAKPDRIFLASQPSNSLTSLPLTTGYTLNRRLPMSALTLDEYRAYLLGIANRQLRTDLRPKVGGSDLVQETFLAAWTVSRNGSFTPEDLRLWLRGILRNRIGRCHRRYVTAAKRSVVSERSLADVGEPGGEDDFDSNETAAAVRAAIDRLRPHERDVMAWRLDDELSWQEIAVRLDSTEEAARKVFTRSLAQLRGLLSPDLDPARDS
jgi:RNA polymerase sigma-70 factor, ECF subfamily